MRQYHLQGREGRGKAASGLAGGQMCLGKAGPGKSLI